MDIFIIILESVAALLGIGVIGFWIVQRNILPESAFGFLSRLAIDIALPSIVFANIITGFAPSEFPKWWQLPLWWLFFSASALVITLITMFLSARNTRSEFAISLFFQNGIFFPIIILSGLMGSETPFIAQLFIFIVFHPSMYFSTYQLFFRKSAVEPRGINLRRVLNPVFFATLIAIALKLLGVHSYLPNFVITIFQMLGDMTLPLLLIILGGSLYLHFRKKGEFYTLEVIKFVIVKNIIFPLIFLGLLLLIRPDYNIAIIIILQSAVPPITGIPVVTERIGGNSAITMQFILASFVFSIISVPLVFNLFNMFFPML